jgi:hypothetical protein
MRDQGIQEISMKEKKEQVTSLQERIMIVEAKKCMLGGYSAFTPNTSEHIREHLRLKMTYRTIRHPRSHWYLQTQH